VEELAALYAERQRNRETYTDEQKLESKDQSKLFVFLERHRDGYTYIDSHTGKRVKTLDR